jgi:hypothetical protein
LNHNLKRLHHQSVNMDKARVRESFMQDEGFFDTNEDPTAVMSAVFRDGFYAQAFVDFVSTEHLSFTTDTSLPSWEEYKRMEPMIFNALECRHMYSPLTSIQIYLKAKEVEDGDTFSWIPESHRANMLKAEVKFWKHLSTHHQVTLPK